MHLLAALLVSLSAHAEFEFETDMAEGMVLATDATNFGAACFVDLVRLDHVEAYSGKNCVAYFKARDRHDEYVKPMLLKLGTVKDAPITPPQTQMIAAYMKALNSAHEANLRVTNKLTRR